MFPQFEKLYLRVIEFWVELLQEREPVQTETHLQLLLHFFPESQLLPGDLPSQAESAPQEDLQTFEQEPPEHLKGLHEEVFIHRQN